MAFLKNATLFPRYIGTSKKKMACTKTAILELRDPCPVLTTTRWHKYSKLLPNDALVPNDTNDTTRY